MPGQFNHGKDSDQVSVRLPLRTRLHLQKLATDNERPIAAEIRKILKEYLEVHPIDDAWLDQVEAEISNNQANHNRSY